MRVQGEPPIKDQSANHAFDNCHKTLEFYKKFFNWNSIDNKNMVSPALPRPGPIPPGD